MSPTNAPPAPRLAPRGAGHVNLLFIKDYGVEEEELLTFRAETEIRSSSTNKADMARLRELLETEQSAERDRKIVAILHRLVDAMGTPRSQANRAKALFSVAFGLPPETSGGGKKG